MFRITVAIVCILWASLLLVTWGDQEGMSMEVHAATEIKTTAQQATVDYSPSSPSNTSGSSEPSKPLMLPTETQGKI